MRKNAQIALAALGLMAAPSVSRADLIWDNGAFTTSGVALTFGWNQSVTTPYRFALTDDFVLTGPAVLTKFTAYGHMPGNTVNQPQILAMYVRILADSGGQPGAQILGDFETGLPFTEVYTGSNYAGSSSNPIYKLEATLPNWLLCPGRYWVQYNVDNSDIRPSTGGLNANFFSTLVQPPPPTPTGWHYSVLTNEYFSLQENGPPFAIEGSLLPACAHLGDFDSDNECTGADIQPFVSALVSGVFNTCADFDGNCEMNTQDVLAFLACLLS